MLTFTGCKKKNDAPITPITTSSKSGTPYKAPTVNGGGVTIVDEPAAPITSTPAGTNTTSDAALEYEVEEDFDGVSIVRYVGEGGKIIVPTVINSQNVVKIDEHAFRGADVTSVTIPGAIREIETHAFTGCDMLETLTISEGVEIIDGYAFSNCQRLTLVTLPDSLREINAGAFSYCPNVQVTFRGETYTAVNIEELYELSW